MPFFRRGTKNKNKKNIYAVENFGRQVMSLTVVSLEGKIGPDFRIYRFRHHPVRMLDTWKSRRARCEAFDGVGGG